MQPNTLDVDVTFRRPPGARSVITSQTPPPAPKTVAPVNPVTPEKVSSPRQITIFYSHSFTYSNLDSTLDSTIYSNFATI